MIIDKLPPPPYSNARTDPAPMLSALPAHLLLRIIAFAFPPSPPAQRKTLYWLAHSLRRVDRALYAASMHVLRSAHLSAYTALVRPPYTSDPFPAPDSAVQRETAVLDSFIALKVREDVMVDDSELHLERDEAYRDLFDHAQPRARLEDLVRDYGIPAGLVTTGTQTPAPEPHVSPVSPSTPPKPSFLSFFRRLKSTPAPAPTPAPISAPRDPIPIANLSITLAPRSAGLVFAEPTSRRTIVSTPRTKDEPLEHVARRLLRALESDTQ